MTFWHIVQHVLVIIFFRAFYQVSGRYQSNFQGGLYKRTQTAALRQAKFYLLLQALAAALQLQVVYFGCRSRRDAAVDKMTKNLSTAASHLLRNPIAIVRHLVYCGAPKKAPKCHSLSPFIRSPFLPGSQLFFYPYSKYKIYNLYK